MSARGRWLGAWAGAAAIGVVNGATRELTYAKLVGDRPANRISVLTRVSAFALYFLALQRRWPLAGSREALTAGGASSGRWCSPG